MNITSKINNKLITISEAEEFCKDAKNENKKVVLAHGIFDLFHIGHVRHLENAKKNGDFLLVSISEDKYVNKGPGRPVFPAQMRAELLSALQIIDKIIINDGPTAINVINQVKPDIYIKGVEYADADKDVTGKIAEEKKAIENAGGKLVFTDDIVFSSSTLINKHLDIYDPKLREYLDNVRNKGLLDKIKSALNAVSNYKVLLVGDTIIDEYQHVTSMGKSAKENMIAVRFQNKELFAGGVIAAANHVASICAEVEVITCLGEYDSYEELIRESLKPNIKLNVIHRTNSPTTRKSRFVEQPYVRKMFEVYFFEDSPLDENTQKQLDKCIEDKIREFDLTIVTDFGHGMISDSTIDILEKGSRFLAVNAQSNSANHGYNLVTKYPIADYICIDAPEARLAVADKYSDIEVLISEKLTREIHCPNIAVTHGDSGCITYSKGEGIDSIPAFTKTVVDTVGAGDAFLSITSPIVASGAPLEIVGFIGNAAGALKVGIIGHRQSVEKAPLVKYITALLK